MPSRRRQDGFARCIFEDVLEDEKRLHDVLENKKSLLGYDIECQTIIPPYQLKDLRN